MQTSPTSADLIYDVVANAGAELRAEWAAKGLVVVYNPIRPQWSGLARRETVLAIEMDQQALLARPHAARIYQKLIPTLFDCQHNAALCATNAAQAERDGKPQLADQQRRLMKHWMDEQVRLYPESVARAAE